MMCRASSRPEMMVRRFCGAWTRCSTRNWTSRSSISALCSRCGWTAVMPRLRCSCRPAGCALNFAYLMAEDVRRALLGMPGGCKGAVDLRDYCAARENEAVNEGCSFADAFPKERKILGQTPPGCKGSTSPRKLPSCNLTGSPVTHDGSAVCWRPKCRCRAFRAPEGEGEAPGAIIRCWRASEGCSGCGAGPDPGNAGASRRLAMRRLGRGRMRSAQHPGHFASPRGEKR
jgi:hypothetical protein